jgi:Zn-finger nucleic acid-binding protein
MPWFPNDGKPAPRRPLKFLEKITMDCPRCRLLLAEAEYEGEQVHFCGTCWGYWLTRSQLDQITGGVKYRFGEREAQTIKQTLRSDGDANRQGSEREAVSCPVCGVEMKRKRYTINCPVQIDECDQHGLWLDTGEIKDLQVFIERSME